MNAIWIIRWERFKWIASLGPLIQWRDRRRTRRQLLATPGVDHLVRSVMDMRYGKYGWRVIDDMLMARVQSHGQGLPWWGPIGPLRSIHTRKWLTAAWMEHKGIKKEEVSHAKVPSLDASEPSAPGKNLFYSGPFEPDYYQRSYDDTEPLDDDGRTGQ